MTSTGSARRGLVAIVTLAMAVAACSGDLAKPGSMLQGIRGPESAPTRAAEARRAPSPPLAPTPAPPVLKPDEKTPGPGFSPPRDVPGLSARRPPGLKPDVTFVIRLASLEDMSDLDARPGVAQMLDAALLYPDSQIYLTVYVTQADTKIRHSDSSNLTDQLVIDMARYLAEHGIDPNRITGKGGGIDEAVGRAVVVSLEVGGPARGRKPPPAGVRPTRYSG